MPPPVNDTRNDCEAVSPLWTAFRRCTFRALPQPAAEKTTTTNDTNDNDQRDGGFGMGFSSKELKLKRTGMRR